MSSLMVASNEAKLVALAKASYSPELSVGELRVIHDSVRPGPGEIRPEDKPEGRHVRGEFLRWMLNDARAASLFDPDGVQVVASTIDGALDLNNARMAFSLTFQRCVFTGSVTLEYASMESLEVLDSRSLGNWNLSHAQVNGELSLAPNFQLAGMLWMAGVQVKGDLELSGASLMGKNAGGAMNLSNCDIQGGFFLEGMNCAGEAVLVDSKFGSEVIASGARFGSGLVANSSIFGGSVMLDGVHVSGGIGFNSTQVAGSVFLGGANLTNAASSLFMRNAIVSGDLYLTKGISEETANTAFYADGDVDLSQATIKGTVSVNRAAMKKLDCSNAQIGNLLWIAIGNAKSTKLYLNGATVKSFIDAKNSWPSKGDLRVRGFAYEQITLDVPDKLDGVLMRNIPTGGDANPADRIMWLNLQSTEDVINPQPWLELADYVKSRGNLTGSKRVIYQMQRIVAQHSGWMMRGLTFPYDVVDEDPLRLFFPVLLLWAFGWVIFWRARRMAAMSPTDKEAFAHFEEKGQEPPHYPPFTPAVYALENVLPVVKLGQDSTWGPNPRNRPPMREHPWRWIPRLTYGWLAVLRWLLIVVGWVLALILAAAIGDQFKV